MTADYLEPAESILMALRIRGASIRVDGWDLATRDPHGLPNDLRAAIRDHKSELIALLSPSDGPEPSEEEQTLMARMDKGISMLMAMEPGPEYERYLAAFLQLEARYKRLADARMRGGAA